MNKESKKSYQSLFKATGVFGFLQVSKIAFSIITNKFVSVFIGPIGLGLIGLLNNIINLVISITNFEFLKTATREIAIKSNNEFDLKNVISIIYKMSVFIGIISAFFSIIFSKYLSYLTFGSYNKQYWFIILAIYFFITSLSNARISIIQGLNKIKIVAISNIIASFFISIGTIVIFYYYKVEGIIWVTLYSSIIMFIVNYYFTKEYPFTLFPINLKEFYANSLPTFKLGFLMSLNLIFGQICYFLLRMYLKNNGESNEILGFYEVSVVIMVNYLGLIFQSMLYDFFPKLSSISSDNIKIKNLVNNQIEIAIILVTPAIVTLYVFCPLVIKILYTSQFLDSLKILNIALLSVILKAIVFPLGYIVLAKGDKMIYFKQALLGDVLNLGLSILFFYFFGLSGIGLAFVINFLIYGLYIYYITNKLYEFSFDKNCLKLIIVNIGIGFLALIINIIFEDLYKIVFLVVLIMVSVYYSFIELNKRIDIKTFFSSKFKK